MAIIILFAKREVFYPPVKSDKIILNVIILSIMSKRTFLKQQKLSILKEASEQGVTVTLEKYGIYPVYNRVC